FYGGSLHSPTTLSSRPYGLNFFGLYKVKVSGKISVFGKAGLHAMFRLRSRYNDYYYDGYYSGGGYYDEYGGYYYDDSGPDKTGMGAGFGLGIEHELSKKLALRVGGTYKILTATDGDSSWFKLYTALSYRVK
ncbi:MAG: hypothetical protein GY950_16105, partial [bacterium]|nr:hypothetical protein [bacterium]